MSDVRGSPNFTLAEFLLSNTARSMGVENFPTWQVVDNLTRLAAVMERVRALLDTPITITSGFRCPVVNTAVGGVPDSAHLYGLACDFTASGYGNTSAVCRALEPHLVALGVDELIDESPPDGWCHLAIAADGCIPRYQSFAA